MQSPFVYILLSDNSWFKKNQLLVGNKCYKGKWGSKRLRKPLLLNCPPRHLHEVLPVAHKWTTESSPVYESPRGEDPEGRMTELVNASEMVSCEKHPGEGNGKPPMLTCQENCHRPKL